MRMCHFRAQNGPFVTNKIFLVQTIIITFIYLLALFIVQNFKKFLQQIQSYEDVQFLGPKWPISPNENLFREPVNEPCFFHSCLYHAKNQSQILIYWWNIEILILKSIKEYWNLIGWEPFLAMTWEPDFSQACSFCRMFRNHKNFHFTPC